MANYQNKEELSQLTLGKATEYVSEYNPKLLQAVPRSLNRDDLNLSEGALPFTGEDVWYGYELSWLNAKGKPIVAVAEFRFPCTSPNIVESKSFKLYLNSFNQTRFSSTEEVINRLNKDLSYIAQSQATVELYDVEDCPALVIAKKNEKIICIDDQDISIDSYQYNPNLLHSTCTTNKPIEQQLVSHILKSNCLITNQPDWASVYIHYKGQAINHEGLLKYIISFREHNEFHEQCVERIFMDLMQHCELEELTVFARYTRRGGLDINPFRSTHLAKAPLARTLRQ